MWIGYSCARVSLTPAEDRAQLQTQEKKTLDLDHIEDGLSVTESSSVKTHWSLERMPIRFAQLTGAQQCVQSFIMETTRT